MALQTRDKILKEGVIRYRQNVIGLQKWKSRHVVFKVTHAGRLQLTIHKDNPPTAANEIKEIAIDEFGGLDSNLKIDNEKYVFAIITTYVTECFSTESPQELTEWIQLLQEYLGKELTININIPVKQHLLKTGKATLRIRNTGFTITTCDIPPRCQGTWHIIHIRKYGGTELFRFQTGSKCPTGEFLYAIETKDNAGIKKLFNDLSNHKPIFADDRLGRRMTLERSFHKNALGKTHVISRTGISRLSLQPTDRSSNKHLYENREMQGLHDSTSLSVPCNGVRRASVDNGVLFPTRSDSIPDGRQGTPIRKVSYGEDSDTYQNIQQNKSSQQDRVSPTKKLHLTPISVPIPEGYYNLMPPSLVRRHYSSNTSPPSSPEENILCEQIPLRSLQKSPDPSDRSSYENFSPDIAGHNSIVKPTMPIQHPPTSVKLEFGSVYQNLDFMKVSYDRDSKRGVIPESLHIDEVAPSVPATISEEPWSPHNYTNVELAQANIQGQFRKNSEIKTPITIQSSLDNVKAGAQQLVDYKVNRLPPPKSSRDSFMHSVPLMSTSSDDLLNPSPITTSPIKTTNTTIRNSHSNFELYRGSRENGSLNHFVPKLPANSTNHDRTFGIRNRFVLSTDRQSFPPDIDHDSTEILSPGKTEYSQVNVLQSSKERYLTIDDVNVNSTSYGGKIHRRSSSCDCLDMCGPADNSDSLLIDDRPDSCNAVYDKLAPRIDTNRDNSKSVYCSSQSNEEDLDSQFDRKLSYLRHEHKYEYIDWNLEHKGSTKSGSNSPIGMEHPLDWTKTLPINLSASKTSQSSSKVTNTLSRRKHLPLQELNSTETEQKFLLSKYNTIKPRPPRLSRGQSMDSTDYHTKNMPLSSKPSQHSSLIRSSPDSNELLSSTDSIPGTKRESVFSNVSSSSGELDIKRGDSVPRKHPTSPSNRVFREEVSIKSKPAIVVDVTKESPLHEIILKQPPPIPKKGLKEPLTSKTSPEESGITNNDALDSSPPIPPRLKEGRFTVHLPQGQIDIVKPPPLPKPRVIMPDSGYIPISFPNEGKQMYSSIEPFYKGSNPPLKIAQTSDNVSYVAVDFDMTLGLERTSEQVKMRLGEFFNGDQQS